MKSTVLKRMTAGLTATALAAICTITAGAANWNDAYAEDGSCKIVSTDADKLVFTTGTWDSGGAGFAYIEWENIIADGAQLSKVAKATWDVTYSNLSALNKANVYAILGAATSQTESGQDVMSETYLNFADNILGKAEFEGQRKATPEWKDEHTMSQVMTFNNSSPTGVLFFADWTKAGIVSDPKYIDLGKYGVTVTISNFKIFDKSGKELKQNSWHYGERYDYRISLLKTPFDREKIRRIEYTVTYSGLTALNGSKLGGLINKAWTGLKDSGQLAWSKGAEIKPDKYSEDGKPFWLSDNVQVTDTLTLSGNPSEWVFFGDMSYNWHGDYKLGKLFADNIKITYSDLKFYDADGNILPLKDGLSIAKTYKCPENRPKVRATAAKTKLTLRWDEIPNATKYCVMKVENGKLKKLAVTKDLKYTVKKLKSGTEYSYAVKAYVNGKWTQIAKKDIIAVKTK